MFIFDRPIAAVLAALISSATLGVVDTLFRLGSMG